MTDKQHSAPGQDLTTVEQAPHDGNLMQEVDKVRRQAAALNRLYSEVLREGLDKHYAVIPGTQKPTLLKPGAEKIAQLLHLAPSFTRQITYHDDGHLSVLSECGLSSQVTGRFIASAGGLCSTRETKYAYRQGTRRCPQCGAEAIIKGRQEYGGGWLCFQKKGGCGAEWPDNAPEIKALGETQEDNPNLADAYNTALKMADKRAFTAAILFGTGASDIFTQDVEDFGPVAEQPATPQPAPAQRQQRPPAQSRDQAPQQLTEAPPQQAAPTQSGSAPWSGFGSPKAPEDGRIVLWMRDLAAREGSSALERTVVDAMPAILQAVPAGRKLEAVTAEFFRLCPDSSITFQAEAAE